MYMLNPEFIGTTIYIKSLDRSIEVCKENIDILRTCGAEVFLPEIKPSLDKHKQITK